MASRRKRSAATSAAIVAEANRLHSKFPVSVEEAKQCLGRLIDTFPVATSGSNNNIAGSFSTKPRSLFADVLEFFTVDQAVQLVLEADLEMLLDEDLTKLATRIEVRELLAREETPFFTLIEVVHQAERLLTFLRAHHDYLVSTGLPPKLLPGNQWLYVHLGKLYPTRATWSDYPCERDDEEPYRWLKRPKKPFSHSELIECANYKRADFLSGVSQGDGERIERDRKRLFGLKMRILEKLINAASHQSPADTLWGECLMEFRKALNAEEMQFYLQMDRRFLGSDLELGDGTAFSEKRSPGGVTNLLEVIGCVEAELQLGLFDQTKQQFAELDENIVNALKKGRGYFNVTSQANRASFDSVLDNFHLRAEAGLDFWRKYRDRLQTALRVEFWTSTPAQVEVLSCQVKKLESLVMEVASAIPVPGDHGELMVRADGKNIFRRSGNSWTIQFAGTMIAKPHSKGLQYIAMALRQPNRELDATTARAEDYRRNTEVDSTSRGEISISALGQGQDPHEQFGDGLHVGTDFGGEMLDRDAEIAYRREISSLEEQIKIAGQAGNQTPVIRLRQDLSQIKRQWNNSHGLGNLRKPESNAKKNDADAVRIAINRVFKDLKHAHPALYQHLRLSLKISGTLQYAPEPIVDWEL